MERNLAYEDCVFINCPFDEDYRDLFYAVVFTVHACGFIARTALEVDDSGEARVVKLIRIVSECKFGVHDLSRTELDSEHQLPRFNMPLELGLFIGATWMGESRQREKRCLVLDKERFRYQIFCSDLAGHDIKSHGNDLQRIIRLVRDFLANTRDGELISGGQRIWRDYGDFLEDLPDLCAAAELEVPQLTFTDYALLVVEWLRVTERSPPLS